MPDDGYAQYYADRIWQKMPAIYRAMDVPIGTAATGPLQELVNRIGTQAAVVRRSIDRLAENQSIETCDDWVIPYIGDLVATRLVACLDARAQRIDVAKTIYYRRRTGTLGLLEELAADIAGRDARTVEFFRRLARTRHQFDPPLSDPLNTDPASDRSLTVAQDLRGAYTGTPAGGFADLRNNYGASNTGSPFDEFAYTADLRAGSQSLGWYNIGHLGVFIWWLYSLNISGATPVSNAAPAPCYTFDPTGRDIPLFAASQRPSSSTFWGEDWVSPSEWQLPVPIRQSLWLLQVNSANPPLSLFDPTQLPPSLYPASFWVGLEAGGTSQPLPITNLNITPETGRFSFNDPTEGNISVMYNYGFSSRIGACGFVASTLDALPTTTQTTTIDSTLANPLTSLQTALAAPATSQTIQIGNSITYTNPVASIPILADATVVLAAGSDVRPVLRWDGKAGTQLTLQGPSTADPTVTATLLVIQGIYIQGADLVLAGNFDTVQLNMMTLDPGTQGAALNLFATAIDGVALKPTTLYIEGKISNLIVQSSITGPIRTRNGGAVETLTVSDSIIQSIPTFLAADAPVIFDPGGLATLLQIDKDPIAQQVLNASPGLAESLTAYKPGTAPSKTLQQTIATAIASVPAAETEWPLVFADLALGFSEGTVSLSRTTVMGPTFLHELSASESILDSIATIDDAQQGCVRFSAYASGSNLHQPYECVATNPQPPIFVSRLFGQPDFARLREDADNAILSPSGGTILEGAQNGAEMGAFSLEQVSLLKQGLAIKYQEFMPIGQLPVWIDVNE